MMPTETLLAGQTQTMIRRWGQSIARHYPHAIPYWHDPVVHFELMKLTLLGAVEGLDWPAMLGNGGTVLDIGAGTGWLSAFLSKQPVVQRVDALDIDTERLDALLPEMSRRVDGDMSKIRPLIGLMEPLPFPDESYDIIVASSSVHHATSLSAVVQEARRVLKRDGVFLILNETPRTFENYIEYTLRLVEAMLIHIEKQETDEYHPVVSANGILYDAKLGDRAYAYYHYCHALTEAGLRFGVIDSGLYTGELELVHFVCTRTDGSRDPASMGARPPSPEKVQALPAPTRGRLHDLASLCGREWLEEQLKRHQAAVEEQRSYIGWLEEQLKRHQAAMEDQKTYIGSLQGEVQRLQSILAGTWPARLLRGLTGIGSARLFRHG